MPQAFFLFCADDLVSPIFMEKTDTFIILPYNDTTTSSQLLATISIDHDVTPCRMDELSLLPAKAPFTGTKYPIPFLLLHDIVPANVSLLLHQFFQVIWLFPESIQKCSNKIAFLDAASFSSCLEMSSEDRRLSWNHCIHFLPAALHYVLNLLYSTFFSPPLILVKSHQWSQYWQNLCSVLSLHIIWTKPAFDVIGIFTPSLNILLTCFRTVTFSLGSPFSSLHTDFQSPLLVSSMNCKYWCTQGYYLKASLLLTKLIAQMNLSRIMALYANYVLMNLKYIGCHSVWRHVG